MNWHHLQPVWEPRMLSILRIMTGLLFMEHGLAKIFHFPVVANPRPYVLLTLVPGLAGLLEAIGGGLIALGLFTRPVAFVLSGEMAFAYFMSHAPRGFFPAGQRRRCGDPLLLRFSLFLCGRRRRVEPRSAVDDAHGKLTRGAAKLGELTRDPAG